jgi:aspartate beta-hydroxylase
LLAVAATQALANGQTTQAARLAHLAEAESPRHPLVLNERARQLLLSGNPAGAHEILLHAVEDDPSQVSLWLNLAAARRGLSRVADEMFALERALAIQPNNIRALLQKASLLELTGKAREAAATYRLALQTMPPGVEPPPAMRPVVRHAEEVIAERDMVREVVAGVDEYYRPAARQLR